MAVDRDRVDAFIGELAAFLVEDDHVMKFARTIGQPYAKQWARLRMLTPLSNEPCTVEEAAAVLRSFLLGDKPCSKSK